MIPSNGRTALGYGAFALALLCACPFAAADEPAAPLATHRVTFDNQSTGVYGGDRVRQDWPGLVSQQCERARIVSRTDALRGRNGQALRVVYPRGKVGSAASGARFKVRLLARDEYYLDYYVRFGHGNGDHWQFSRGGKLPGLAGGDCNTGGRKPTGDGWSARYMWRDDGRMFLYLYHLDQPDDFGEQIPLNHTFRAGRWYRLTQRIRLNTAARADGVVQVFVDGQPALDLRTVRFRLGAKAPIDHFLFSTFYGGSDGSWSPEIETIAYFDQVRIQADSTLVSR